jgi:hypothetical protein
MALQSLPAQLPKSQADWERFVNVMQGWQQQIQAPQWQTPELLNGWTDYGSGWASAGYLTDISGRVWLKGLVKDGALSSTLFQLPHGGAYRHMFPALCDVGGTEPVLARIDIDTSGNVILEEIALSGAVGWLSLDGISFGPGS